MQENIIKEQDLEQNSYDLVNYESHAFYMTAPYNLFTVGKIFGHNAPDFNKAKVLELGCASGGNIIPLASLYPNSSFVGIDLSKKQIEQGKKVIEDLGLKNIELKAISITDIKESFGKFDYIICHGVFSWVPQEVQDAILKICSKNLTKEGLAYISYNTLPGWNMVKTIRDMMLYHSKRFKDAKTKIEQSRALLKFVAENSKNTNKNYNEVVQNELNLLNNQADYYLFHEHLEGNNIPMYFSDFIKMAEKHELKFLSETNFKAMLLDNWPQGVKEVLKNAGKIEEIEQYLDFITNRRFRMTVLCHKDTKINRNIDFNIVKDAYLMPLLEKVKEDEEKIIFKVKETSREITAKKENDFMKVFSEVKIPTHFSEIIKKAKLDKDENSIDNLAKDILKMIFFGGAEITFAQPLYTLKVSDTPKVFDYTAYEAKNSTRVTNTNHKVINIDLFSRILLQYLDGKNDISALKEKMLSHFIKGELELKENAKKITKEEEIMKKLDEMLPKLLSELAKTAILIS